MLKIGKKRALIVVLVLAVLIVGIILVQFVLRGGSSNECPTTASYCPLP